MFRLSWQNTYQSERLSKIPWLDSVSLNEKSICICPYYIFKFSFLLVNIIKQSVNIYNILICIYLYVVYYMINLYCIIYTYTFEKNGQYKEKYTNN